ncbi:MAG: precorrin-2 C(20)-methyltransferase [Lachnospiraceae bacterium]|jgi:precorrin-2/cobalt-factor-2 C20-methyltransferase|nr:precorrin-2 C(20)-methyltransferase [Lachnospiraceae bacterium]MDE7057208.1 precorrin-2 C(20)-methyltransferase [Lachnospiraceae bacterium]
MAGILYGVGVGPGDPELMTLKAVRLIQENEVIVFPGPVAQETVAYQIAVQAVPELANKTLVAVEMPMTHDQQEMTRNHDKAADTLESYLKAGQNVVFLTLGDPTIYSTCLYVQKRMMERGYKTQLVSGITSFCAAAARTNTPLVEWNEQLHILPAVHRLDSRLELSGNYILMKSGKKMNQVKEILADSNRDIVMVENCGMENEHIYRSVEEIPDDAGYYSLIIAKEPKTKHD